MVKRVWICSVSSKFRKLLTQSDEHAEWAVPGKGGPGDLLLFYFAKPESCLKEIFVQVTGGKRKEAWWRPRKTVAFIGRIRRVYRMPNPIRYRDFREHDILKHAPFVRGNFQGSPKQVSQF